MSPAATVSVGLLRLNDLMFDLCGNCYLADQGQSGLQDPSGKGYWLRPNGQLDCVMQGIPSRNELALYRQSRAPFGGATRANALWREPLLADGAVSEVAAFQAFLGTSGLDGVAWRGVAWRGRGQQPMANGRLGSVFIMNARGEITHVVRSSAGSTVINVAFQPGTTPRIIQMLDEDALEVGLVRTPLVHPSRAAQAML